MAATARRVEIVEVYLTALIAMQLDVVTGLAVGGELVKEHAIRFLQIFIYPLANRAHGRVSTHGVDVVADNGRQKQWSCHL